MSSVKIDVNYRTEETRGFLMCAVVVGHNAMLTGSIPNLFQYLYFWHVLGFFLVSALSPNKAMDAGRLWDLAVRYLVPFAIFITSLSAVRFLANPAPVHIERWLDALLFGTASASEVATGASLFWFLPTLFSVAVCLSLLRTYLANYDDGRRFSLAWTIALLIGVLILIAVPFIPTNVMTHIPVGAGLVLYIVPISLIFVQLMDFLNVAGKGTAFLAAFLGAAIILAEVFSTINGNSVNISVYKFARPESFSLIILNLAAALAANGFVFTLFGRLLKSKILAFIGRKSMQVFVFHSFFQFAAVSILSSGTTSMPIFVSTAFGLIVSIGSIAGSLGVSVMLDRFPRLKRLIFPRDVADFRQAFELKHNA